MNRFAIAFLLLLAAAPSLQASWGYVPLEYFVDRTEYVLHLKVVEIEKTEWKQDGGKDGEEYQTEYAVCEVKEILFGMIVGDSKGRVRLSSINRRQSTKDGGTKGVGGSTDLRHGVGTELTLIASSSEFIEGRGTVFFGGGHPSCRRPGAPPMRLRKLIQARMNNAYGLLDKFDRIVPKARAAAKAAVIEHEKGEREDYKDLSPEADLLLDLVATNRGAPAEANSPRRDLDAKTRKRLRLLALRTICGVSAISAKAALPLLGGEGHGAAAMLTPAEIKLDTALTVLQKLEDLGDLRAILPQLIRQDVKHRALTWAAHLVLKGGHAGKLGEWIWVEHLANESDATGRLKSVLVPKKGLEYPYASDDQRLLARLVDVEAWALVTIYQRIRRVDLKDPAGDPPDLVAHKTRVKELSALHERPAYLAVYTFIRAIAGKDSDELKYMRRRLEKQDRYKGENQIDLDDLATLRWRVSMDYGSLPRAIVLAIRNHSE